MSKLGEILREEALAEIAAITAESEQQAQALVREAREKASSRLAAHRKRVEAEGRSAVRRAESAADLTVSTSRIQAKGEMIERVRSMAFHALLETAESPKYDEILRRLAQEAVEVFSEAEAVVTHPDDEARVKSWASERRLHLRTDPGLKLGVRIVAPGGGRSMENTLPERLRRAWDTLSSGVAKRLWG